MTSTARAVLGVLAAGVLAGCSRGGSSTPAPAAGAPGSGENPGMVVARYDGRTITLKDVDAEIAQELRQKEKEKLELRQRAAQNLAFQELVKAEAARQGLSEEQYLKANVDDKLPPPSEEEIARLFEGARSQMPPGATLDMMRPQIISFLNSQRRQPQMAQLFQELTKKANFQLLLEEPAVKVEAKGPARGPENAKVTIVEFSDFECPFCSRAEETVTQVMEQYAGKVRLVYRHFPLSGHPNAGKAAEAAACAAEQSTDKFWAIHKAMFDNQRKLTVPDLKGYAGQVGLDQARFDECLDSGKMKAVVDADQKAGAEAGVSGTPAFFINGRLLSGAQPLGEFSRIIDAELAKGG